MNKKLVYNILPAKAGGKASTEMPHKIPADLKQAIVAVPKVQALWGNITPLARNEWVCWVVSGKQEKTRGIRIAKAISKMKSGMRRPCCWIGCPHRTDKPISPSVQWVLNKQSKQGK